MRAKKMIQSVPMRIWVLLLACAVTVTASLTISYAWMSQNMKVSETGMVWAIEDDMLMDQNDRYVAIKDDNLTLDNLGTTLFLPGTEMNFNVCLLNLTEHSISISELGLESGKAWVNGVSSGSYADLTSKNDYDEVPKYVNDTYCYLGQYMKIAVISYAVYTNTTYEAETHTVTLNDTPDPTVIPEPSFKSLLTGVPTSETIGQEALIELTEGSEITLEKEDAVVFTFKVVFENEDNDQSLFAEFAFSDDNAEKCTRMIYVDYENNY